MINLIKNTTLKIVKTMNKIDTERIRMKYSIYNMLRNLNSKAAKKGIQILTESPEENVRAEEDKQIIRFEEDLSLISCEYGMSF